MTGDLRFFWKKFGKIWIGFIALLSPAIDPTRLLQDCQWRRHQVAEFNFNDFTVEKTGTTYMILS
jgi:hypothetical protein